MARLARGEETLEKARELLAKVTKADELRAIQALMFPLVNRMSIQETARAVGRSPRWVTNARNEFIRSGGVLKKSAKKIRNRAHMTNDEEKAFLAPFFEHAREGGTLVASEIHKALERHLGHRVALASAYNLLHRHGWRKLTPDKRNVAVEVLAQEEWRKNFPPALREAKKSMASAAPLG